MTGDQPNMSYEYMLRLKPGLVPAADVGPYLEPGTTVVMTTDMKGHLRTKDRFLYFARWVNSISSPGWAR